MLGAVATRRLKRGDEAVVMSSMLAFVSGRQLAAEVDGQPIRIDCKSRWRWW